MNVRRGFVRGGEAVVAAMALAAVLGGASAGAGEGKGDLNVQLRLIETVPAKGSSGASPAGVAHIEVSVDAFRATEAIRLQVQRPDGSSWIVKGRPVRLDRPVWTDPSGKPWEQGAEGASIPARGLIRTDILVPLEGAAIHEVVIVATGLADGQALLTESALRIPLGVPDGQPVDDGAFANFPLQGVK